MESTSWQVVKRAFIGIMHVIKAGKISWTDRQASMQRMNHTHTVALSPQPMQALGPKPGMTVEQKLPCKFFKACTCHEMADFHVDLFWTYTLLRCNI